MPRFLTPILLICFLLLMTIPHGLGQETALKSFSITYNGHVRHAYLYTPGSYHSDRPAPLVLAFHGYLGSGPQMIKTTRFNELAEKEGFLVAYPETLRLGEKWQANAGPSDSSEEDVEFIRALIQHIQSSRNVDRKRVYATGFSSGGFFSQRLACEMPDSIAAIAPVSATLGVPVKNSCHLTRPMPAMIINGTSDPVVTWQGEIRRVRFAFKDSVITTVPQAVAFWRDQNHCDAVPEKTVQVYAARQSKGVQINNYPNCRPPGEVQQIIIQKGGHTWPGSPKKGRLARALVGRTSQEIDATSTIWAFFKRHALP